MTGPGLSMPTPDMSRDQLRNKLAELQAKKARMDDMLMELQSLREDPFLHLNNGRLRGLDIPSRTIILFQTGLLLQEILQNFFITLLLGC